MDRTLAQQLLTNIALNNMNIVVDSSEVIEEGLEVSAKMAPCTPLCSVEPLCCLEVKKKRRTDVRNQPYTSVKARKSLAF